MNAVADPGPRRKPTSAATRRSDLSIALMQICLGIAAEHYMVLDAASGPDAGKVRIFASNWVYDAIEMVGLDALGRMARMAVPLGGAPHPLEIARNTSKNSRICGDPESELARFGHNEIYALRLRAGLSGCCALFSASHPDSIRRHLVSTAQFRSAYLLSEMTDHDSGHGAANPLSERERECLFWAAEGKTTDEAALIVGVSANTANRYIAQAIRKLSAANRARAVAIAIRRGIL